MVNVLSWLETRLAQITLQLPERSFSRFSCQGNLSYANSTNNNNNSNDHDRDDTATAITTADMIITTITAIAMIVTTIVSPDSALVRLTAGGRPSPSLPSPAVYLTDDRVPTTTMLTYYHYCYYYYYHY